MKKASFRFPDAQISGGHGWLKWLLVGVSIITSSSLVFGQNHESPAEQGFAAIPMPEVQHAREAARSVYPARAQRLDLGVFSTQEEDEILELLSVSTVSYTGIYREVRLQRANWALVKQEDGIDVWQAHIHSPDAVSLGLYLRNFHLDPGMAVKLYSLTDEEDPVEEYTGEGRSGDRGGFWSYSMSGDTIVVEFRTPTASRLEPDAFPFAADKVNHTFKDRNGDLSGTQLQKFQARSKVCKYHNKTENTAVLVNSDMPAHVRKASAGTVLICAYGEQGAGCGTGSLLKNKSGDGALYALSVWHLFSAGVNNPNTDDKPYINSDFSIQVKGERAGRARASGSRYLAGNANSDWGLVRIEGQLSGWGDYQLLDWKVHTPETFDGYVLHYSYLLAQQHTPFENAFTYAGNQNASKSTICSGPVCAGQFYADFTGYRVEFGGSGSPAFYEDTSSVVGVYNYFKECNGGFAGMGNIYKNPRVFNALNYGDTYFHGSQFPYIDPDVACAADSQAMTGSGTESDPYQVENLCHLRDIEASPRSHYIQIKDIDASTMTYGWKNGFAPIKVFSGTFDGNGYKISNLKVSVASGRFENTGLFGKLQGGLLKRVKLVNFVTKEVVNVGSLVGLNDRGTIEDSEVDGKVDGYRIIGGLVGLNQGGVIRNSTSTVRVGKNSGDTYVAGGLVGQNEGGTIEGSRALGAVTGTNQVGGLVGVNKGSISNSYSQGTVTGNNQVGGLVGWHFGGTISGSHSGGKVVGTASGIGGLVGVSQDNARIVSSHALGQVRGKNNVGGLVGENKGNISNSYARGTVTGNNQTGGLVGKNSGTVRSAYSTGAVGRTDLPGRLVGVNSGTIAHSYASKLGDVDSLVGGNDGTVQGSALRTVEQMKCSIDPVNLCRSARMYLDWDTRIWHFGHSRMLPVLRVLTNVPAAPLAVRANWNSRGGLTLQWENQGIAVSSFEVEVDGIIRNTQASRFALGGSLMAELRERYVSGSEIHYSIRGVKGGVAGDAASGSFHLMEAPGVVGTQTASGLSTIRVTITEVAADGYGRTLGSSAYGEPTGGVALDLARHVQLFSKGRLKEGRRMTQQEWASSTVVEFSGLEGGSRYEVRVFARNKAGAGPMAVVAPVFTYVGVCPQATVITAAGSGSEDDPWQVGTLCQLQEIRYDTAAHYRLANDIDAKQSHEWRDGKGFSPIESFSGSLDGSGHSILNLLINPGQTDYVGLFGRLNGGALQRLALVNVTVRGRDVAGALAGSVEANGSINGSTVTGLIGGRDRVGGVAGENHGLIELSHSESAVVGTTAVRWHGNTIGGLVGSNVWGARIRSSHARGSVSGANNVGGLVGFNQAPIYHSHAQSTVSGHYFVGGLAGSNHGFISGTYSAGAVSGKGIVGGLAGYHDYNSIVDSHSDSTVIGAGNLVGGLVGLSSGSILKSHATGAVSGNDRVGGLVGNREYSRIEDSYATGLVSGNNQVGGLVGVSERYYGSNGRIENSYATGLVNGNNQAGTLVGHSEDTEMAANYALEQGVGSSALELVGSGGDDTTENNFSRTLAQLQCPLLPGDTCRGAVSYSGWSTQVWYFGDRQMLPAHHALQPEPPAPPSRLQAKWNLEGELELSWTAARTGSLNAGYWVEVAGHSLETGSASFTLSKHLVQSIRSEYESGDLLQLSVRGYNRHGIGEATTVTFDLLAPPGELTDLWASAQAFSLRVLLVAPDDDGYGQSPEDSAYGYTGAGVLAGLGYRVRLYAGGELMQEQELAHTDGEISTTVEFSGLASDSRYEVVATPYNNVGEGSAFFLSAFTRPWQCDGEALASAGGSGGSGGSGSEDNPWQIATLCQLQDIRSAPAAHYRLAGDIEAGPSRDWRAGEGFAPIADFSGSLDGAGFQIFHLMVRSEALEDVGMFAQLQGGLLQQVVLVNAQLWGSANVGTLVGRNEGGRILNSGVTGLLFGGQVAGGLVGINAGTISGSAAQLTTGAGGQVAGGLVGRNLAVGSISTSYAGGSVSGAVRAGGLVADNQGSVTDSYTTAFVTGKGLVAGLVANNQGTVSRSYAAGSVSGAGQTGSFAGSSSGGIVDSYAAELPRVDGGDAGQGSVSLRTLQQLRCPTAPGLACAGRSTYSGWSAETWSFGDYRTLPVLRGFETPGKPLLLQAQWKSPSALLLRWEPPLGGPERIGYRVESGTLFEETLSDYFIAGADWLQKLRARHEGGSTLFLAVRGYNLYGVGEAARVSVRLLDVPDSPADMRVVSGLTTLRLSFTAPANDGYGRKPIDADYAESTEAMALRLAYRIRLYASGELVEERDIPLGNPLSPVTVEFAELQSASEYRLEAFAHNTVGTGSPSTIRAVTRFSGCAGKGLKSAQGDGSNDNPWQIATLCQLQDVRSDLHAHYVQVADIDASPSREWSNEAGFHPIEPFSGTFDGAGRQISALYINRPETDTIGLFSRLAEDGIAKGVVLVDAWVKGKNSVGTLVGFNDGTVMNSVVRSAQVSGNRAGVNIGGLAGGNGGLLIDSGASAEVDGGRYVGGLVGYVKAKGRVVGSTVRASQVHAIESAGGLAGLALGATILHSSADAAVRVSGDGRGNAGGLVGYSQESTILHCYATGSAIAVNGSRAGGLVGYSGSTIAYSYADVSVSGDSRVGGLVNAGSVHASYALGEVQGRSITGGLVGSNIRHIQDSYADVSVSGDSRVGGLVGINSGSVHASYALGEVQGRSITGGLVGSNIRHIQDSYADVSVSGDSRVGGLVGINSGSVHASYALGEVRGHSSIGGLVGSNIRRIQDSYAANRVVGGSGSTGSLAGYSAPDAVIDRSYAPVSAKAALVGNGLTDGALPRTLTQLRCPTAAGQRCADATTYAGWEPGAWHFGNTRTLPLLRAIADIPATPVDLAVRWESPDHLRFTWAAGSSAVDSYELELAGTVREVTAPTFDFNGDFLAEFQRNNQEACPHPYRLRAVHGDIVGYPAAGHFYLPGLPGATTITELVPGQTTARLVLAIMGYGDCASLADNALATSPDRTVSPGFGYVVVVSAAGRSTETFSPADAFDTEVEITHLLPKRNYSLQVYVRNQAGDRVLVQMPGNRGTFSTIAVPGRPTGLQARWESTNRMNLSWEAASSNGATIDGYQLFVDGESHSELGNRHYLCVVRPCLGAAAQEVRRRRADTLFVTGSQSCRNERDKHSSIYFARCS